MMSKNAKPPTLAEIKRWNLVRGHGCICCRKREVILYGPVEIHHLLEGGRRRGHRYTIGLCAWHHRGRNQLIEAEMTDLFGPSLALGSKPFHEVFGTDDELLAYQDELIGWTEPAPKTKGKALTSAKIIRHSGALS